MLRKAGWPCIGLGYSLLVMPVETSKKAMPKSNPLVTAMSLLQSGRLHEAEVICQDVLHHSAREPDALHILGVIAHRSGRYASAVELIQQAIAVQPGHAAYHNSLGNAFQLMGRHADACAAYARALELRPELAETHANLGQSLRDLGRIDEAIHAGAAVVGIKPEYAKGHNQLGLSLKRKNLPEQAIHSFTKAIKLDANLAEAHSNLGSIFAEQRRFEESVDCFRRAVEIAPHVAGYQCNLGNSLSAVNRKTEAAAAWMEAVRLDPNFWEAYNSLGSLLISLEKYSEAMEYLDQALKLRPDSAAAHTNRGIALRELGRGDEALIAHLNAVRLAPEALEPRLNLGKEMNARGKYEEAIACYQEAIRLHPQNADAHNMIGANLNQLGRYGESLSYFEKAIELSPNYPAARWNRALHALLHGDLERGFADYEWRSQRHRAVDQAKDRGRPFWDGTDPAGKTILLRAEQGVGDSIQFIRYVPLLAERGAKVIFSGQESVCELIRSAGGLAAAVSHENEPEEFDFHLPLLSLPHIFRTRLDSIPAKIPYLCADAGKIETWRNRIAREADGLAVGIAWAGNPKHQEDRDRSIALSDFASLGRIANVTFYSLQKGPGASQAAKMPEMNLIDLTADLHDFSDTAAMLENLDLIISVDTAVAHLAGALGRPVWTLLPFMPDWRWMLNRSDTPWYPTMKLFRQRSRGDWGRVVAEVAEKLAALDRSA
jgi:tetratricopeptide (TPR) repeat protein